MTRAPFPLQQMHCCNAQQKALAEMMVKHFSNQLLPVQLHHLPVTRFCAPPVAKHHSLHILTLWTCHSAV
eukprot:1971389-Prymnesium_polylepis.2